MNKKDEQKIPVKYTGDIQCQIPGISKAFPGQTIQVPINIANNLDRDPNWKKTKKETTPSNTSEQSEPSNTSNPSNPSEPTDQIPIKKNKQVKERQT